MTKEEFKTKIAELRTYIQTLSPTEETEAVDFFLEIAERRFNNLEL